MKRRERSQKPVAEINITPFTDVILVLLIIFMVATPLIYQSSIKVQLPQAKAVNEVPKNVNITIDSKGIVFVENNKFDIIMDKESLKYKLLSLIKNPANSSVTINGDKNVKYDFFIKVVDTVSQLGIKQIVLATENTQ